MKRTLLKQYPAERIFSLVPDVNMGGDGVILYFEKGKQVFEINLDRERFRIFKQSQVCVCCGRRGEYFELSKELQGRLWATCFDFRAADGTLMTVDHIIPRALGGTTPGNVQVMCAPCNVAKDKHDPMTPRKRCQACPHPCWQRIPQAES